MFFAALLFLTMLVFYVLFVCGVNKTFRLVPGSVKGAPGWTVWLLLCPYLNVIFAWIFLPFFIPQALSEVLKNKGQDVLQRCRRLRNAGLGICIPPLFAFSVSFFLPIVSLFLNSAHSLQALDSSQVSQPLHVVHNIIMGFFILLQLLSVLLSAIFLIIYWRRMIRLRGDLSGLLADKKASDLQSKES